jgi:hypothetical protein
MRFLLIAVALLAAAGVSASAEEPPNARAAYVERRGLLEADDQCRLFTPDIRAALEIGAARTRGALLRAGWSSAQVRQLDQAVAAAAGGRACDDQRTLASAAEARDSFSVWVNARTMEFPGWARTWIARRSSGGDGWRLSQAIDAPVIAVFGVRDRDGAQRLSLVAPLARGQPAPTSAVLVMRDVARAPADEVSLPQRVAYGLEAGAPRPGRAATHPSTHAIERLDNGASQAVFVFPDSAFRVLLALDPRESVEIRLQYGRRSERLFVEVGDIAAARAFLTIR